MLRAICVFAILVAGCTKPADPGPTCTVVMAHLAVVMKQGMPGHGDLLGRPKADVEQCEARKLTPTQRRCLLATKTLADIPACNAGREPASGSGAHLGSATAGSAR